MVMLSPSASNANKTVTTRHEIQKLEAVAHELRSRLSSGDATSLEQCHIAATEESKIMECKLMSEVTEAQEKANKLQEAALSRMKESAAQGELVRNAEEQVAEVEQREQQLREKDEERKQHHTRIRKLEADHRCHIDSIHSDLRRTKDRSNDDASQLQQNILKTRREFEHLSEQNEREEQVGGIANALRSELNECQKKLNVLEDSLGTMRDAASEKEAEVVTLIERSSRLREMAHEKDEDAELLSELSSCDDRCQATTRQITQLQQVDYIAGNLEAQLSASAQLISDIDTAISRGQSQIDALEVPEDPPATWPEDRDRLQVELVAMHQAGEDAVEHAARLEKELSDVQDRVSSKPMSAISAQSNEALTRRLEHLEAELQSRQSDSNVVDNGASDFEAASHAVGWALEAKGRRIRLLNWRCEQQQQDLKDNSIEEDSAELRTSLMAAEQRAALLEDKVVALGSQLDDCDREVQILRRRREESHRRFARNAVYEEDNSSCTT